MVETDDEFLQLSVVIERCALQIETLGKTTQDIEILIYNWAREISPKSKIPDTLHQLDLLIQTANEIAISLSNVSGAIDPDISLDLGKAFASVRLENLRRSLSDAEYINGDSRKALNNVEIF